MNRYDEDRDDDRRAAALEHADERERAITGDLLDEAVEALPLFPVLPRCPQCNRPVVQERARMRGRSITTPWWWCDPCERRVEPV